MAGEMRLKCVVTGRVQQVGFRAFVLAQARMLGVTGRVRNGVDGRSVEMTVEGASDRIERFVHEIEQGPPLARVEQVTTTTLDGPARYETFEIEP